MKGIAYSGSPLCLTRRTVLCGVGASVANALLSGCSGGSGGSASARENPQPIPSGSLTPGSVAVSSHNVGTIGPRFAGLSYEKNSMAVPRFTPDNTDLIGMLKGLGPSLLRMGGNSVDTTKWNPDGAGRTSGQVAPSDIDALAGFLHATDWTLLYGVNLATSTPTAAAAEVAHAVQSLGSSLYGIEIGNECDLYGGKYFQSWSLQDFEQLWQQFRMAILQAAPDVVVTGPACASHIASWTIPFGQDVNREVDKPQIALLTQHYYRGDGRSPTSTDTELISPDTTLTRDLSGLNAGAAAIGIPFRLAETNSFYSGGATGVSDSYASALWVIDHLFNIALGGGVGANLHGGGSVAAYTPIADNNGSVVEARPEYYGILLFTMVGAGSLLGTSVSAAGINVTAYAVKSISGGLNIVVVNKDERQNLSLTIDCGQMANSAQLLLMTGPALEATSGVEIQGATVGQDGSFVPQQAYTLQTSGNQVMCYVNALSAALLQVK
jgi:hypothetical protein